MKLTVKIDEFRSGILLNVDRRILDMLMYRSQCQRVFFKGIQHIFSAGSDNNIMMNAPGNK